jgi:N-acetylmuramic acid 6-phosphate etherase
MTTEDISPRFHDLDIWPSVAALEAMYEGQLEAVAAVRPALGAIAAAAEAAAPRLGRGGRLVYVGAGTSGRIGVQDGAELPPTFDWPNDRLVFLMAGGLRTLTESAENAEDDEAAGRAGIEDRGIGADDAVVGTAASGTTPFTVAAIAAARRRGALTIGIANNAGSPLLAAAEFPILAETGEEVIAGSTRMKAGTAQKIVLNLFSTLAMMRLGRIHGGLMVDMRVTNVKLQRRAEAIVRAITGVDAAAARAAIERAGGRIKPACLVARGAAPGAAEALLARHGGKLRDALAELARR